MIRFRHKSEGCSAVIAEYHGAIALASHPVVRAADWRITNEEGELVRPAVRDERRAYCPNCRTWVPVFSQLLEEVKP